MGRKAVSYYPESHSSPAFTVVTATAAVGTVTIASGDPGACFPTDATVSAVAVGETSTATTRSRMVATIFLTSAVAWMPPMGRNKPGTMWQKNLGSVAVGFRPPQCGREYIQKGVCGAGGTARPLSCSTSRNPPLRSRTTQLPDFSLHRSGSLFYETMCRAASFCTLTMCIDCLGCCHGYTLVYFP